MMRQYELVERVQAYNPTADEALLNRAYVYGMQKHGSQTRASGDPYFAHPLEVAAILTDLKMDDATIAVALLHDTLEDTDATRAEIDDLFGPEIGHLVEGLTKIERLDLVSREAAQAENLRKLLLAISDDIRVLLVKLADRLHNMRTLEFMRPEKRKRISQETMDIYAPLAGRMGMQEMRGELEDLSFRYLHPEPYKILTDKLNELGQKNKNTITQIEDELREILAARDITATVSGRLKRAYSMFTKMERKSLALEQLSDIFGFRIVVNCEDDCYRALGVVHRNWSVVPGRFKDYISTPKQNDYRSIHTTIIGPGSQRVELQIRTDHMHDIAEYGIAAHALYKDEMSGNMSKLEKESNAYGWLRRTVEHLVEGDNPEDFVEHTKLEFFQDQVFCFTPRGRLISLPLGATPIDFAYAVHTDIGNTCVGCKVNGKIVPVISTLTNGDEVEILCRESHLPPESWQDAVITGKARAAIRRVTRIAAQQKYAAIGEQILLAAVARRGRAGLTEGNLAKLLNHYRLGEPIELYVAIGSGEISSSQALEILHPSGPAKSGEEPSDEQSLSAATRDDEWFELNASPHLQFRMPGIRYNPDEARQVMSAIDPGLPVKFSPEGAVPGDRVIGILMPQEGVTIYPVHAQALEKFHNNPNAIWLDVQWNEQVNANSQFAVAVNMTVLNKPNVLALIASHVGDLQINIQNLQMFAASPDFHEMLFQIQVRDVKHLNKLLFDLRQLKEITRITRATTTQAAQLAQTFVGGPDAQPRISSTMNQEQVLDIFRQCGALLKGHFILSSGLHSSTFLQKTKVFMYPDKTEIICKALAQKIQDANLGPIEQVVSPAVGGIIPGYETARHLGLPAIYTERVEGKFELRRNFEVTKDQPVIIVEDIVSTGLSIRECITSIQALGANVVAAACLIDRSGGNADIGVPLISLVELNVPAYEADKLPPELSAIPAIKPGSRGLK